MLCRGALLLFDIYFGARVADFPLCACLRVAYLRRRACLAILVHCVWLYLILAVHATLSPDAGTS